MSTSESFGKIRSILFPIHWFELKKFIPMTIMIFGILFNYTILRNMKDTLVVNASGAGTLTFLKLYCVTPAALLFVVLFVKLNAIFDREKILYIVMSPFIIFFLLFGFVIYPNLDVVHPSKEFINGLYSSYPALRGFIDIYAYWAYSLFFILAELWGSVCVQVLFWQFVNQVVNMEQSKRFYALFIAYGNVSLIFCGVLAHFLSHSLVNYIPQNADVWLYSLKIQMVIVSLVGLSVMLAYRYLNTSVLPFETQEGGVKKEKKKKPGFIESCKLIFQSKHLALIASLVICYGISINLIEVQFKSQVKNYFAGDKVGFNAFMNSYSQWTGVAALLFTGIAGSGILKRLSWFTGAIVTPLTIGIGGTIFYVAILSENFIKTILHVNPIALAAFSGAVIVAASKVTKYGLFDTTKSMAYIPLSNDIKANGTAAVEVIAGRLGKSGGALVQSMLLIAMATTNVLSIAPVTSIIFIIVCIVWFYAVKALSVEIQKALANKKS